MIGAYLRNPWETAAFAALVAAGSRTPYAFAAAGILFCACEIVAGLRHETGPRWWPAAWPQPGATLTVLYDGTCGLCARSRAHLETWATAGAMRFFVLQSAEARALVPHLDEASYLGALHVVEEGRVWSAEEGWFRLMKLAPLWSSWLAWVTPRALAKPAYAGVARKRYRWFGRAECGEGGCALHLNASGDRPSSPPSGSPDPSSPAP